MRRVACGSSGSARRWRKRCAKPRSTACSGWRPATASPSRRPTSRWGCCCAPSSARWSIRARVWQCRSKAVPTACSPWRRGGERRPPFVDSARALRVEREREIVRLRTVLGDIDPVEVDRVLPHEHLLCDFSPVTGDRNHVFNNPDFAVRELGYMNEDIPPTEGRQHALVEVTLRDLGRDPAGLVRIARASGTHVVMGTGWYLEPYYPSQVFETSATALAAQMIEEIRQGVPLEDGSRVRAGVIGEIGTHGSTLSPAEERVLRAAARASNATGAAVTTHAFLYPTGVDQLDILEEEGVDPDRIGIGHVDTFLDHAYLTSLLRRGVSLQFDTCGRE